MNTSLFWARIILNIYEFALHPTHILHDPPFDPLEAWGVIQDLILKSI